MEPSEYKNYILVLLFIKYISEKALSDKKKGIKYPVIKVPADCYFENFLKLRNKKDIGAQTNIKIEKIAKANDLTNVINNVSLMMIINLLKVQVK